MQYFRIKRSSNNCTNWNISPSLRRHFFTNINDPAFLGNIDLFTALGGKENNLDEQLESKE